mmetsp:Transcript_25583/g.56064  ORF Transcript_25583/g.56064 Transcript_25583/m.56064 type:complete len:228 (+) Transcript_25583:704-1387(+)
MKVFGLVEASREPRSSFFADLVVQASGQDQMSGTNLSNVASTFLFFPISNSRDSSTRRRYLVVVIYQQPATGMGQNVVPRFARFFSCTECLFQVFFLFLDPGSEKVGIGNVLFHLTKMYIIWNLVVVFQCSRCFFQYFFPFFKSLVCIQITDEGKVFRDCVADLFHSVATIAVVELEIFVFGKVSHLFQQVSGQKVLQKYLGSMGLVLFFIQEQFAQENVCAYEGIA